MRTAIHNLRKADTISGLKAAAIGELTWGLV
jgi:hypothetical protein